jgi:F-box and leucine-rich repeat protein 2/20
VTDDALKALALRCILLQSVELAFGGCSPEWPEICFTQDGLVTLIQSCPFVSSCLLSANIFDDEGMTALSCA